MPAGQRGVDDERIRQSVAALFFKTLPFKTRFLDTLFFVTLLADTPFAQQQDETA
jgi:hypothetical protein